MALITTPFISSSGFSTNEKPIDMHPVLYQNSPWAYPVQAILTGRMKESDTSQSKVYWSEQEQIPTEVYTTDGTAAGTAGSTITLTIGNYTYVQDHDVLKNVRTGEVVRVQGSVSSASVTAVAGWGGTTPAATVAGDRWLIMSPAYAEAENSLYSRAIANTESYNNTQEITEMVQTSTRVMNEATFFGGKGTKRDENILKMVDSWRKKFEYTLMFSRRADTADGSYYAKSMNGIEAMLENGTNYFNVNGPLTESKLDSYLADLWSNWPSGGINSRAFVAGAKVINIVNRLCKNSIRISPNTKKYGMRLNQYFGFGAEIDLVPHPLLAGPVLEEMAFILDFDRITLKYQSKPVLTRDVYHHGANFVVDKMYGLVTLMLAEEKRDGIMVGITG